MSNKWFFKRAFVKRSLLLIFSLAVFSVEAGNKQEISVYDGLVVTGVVDLQSMPRKVVSGAIRIKHQSDQKDLNDQYDDIPNELAQLATVSISQAILIAETAYPGMVTEAELDHEDGFLVWEIEIINDQRSLKPVELIIDAGDGRLLAVETSDSD